MTKRPESLVDDRLGAPALPDAGFLRLLYREAPLGIARISLEGHLLAVNPRLCLLLDRPALELLGHSLLDIGCTTGLDGGPGDDPAAAAALLRQWQGGSIARFTLALCRRHPDRLDLALRLSVCAGAPGEGLALFEAIGPRKAPETSVVTERLQHAREVQRLTLSDRESRERADELHGMLAQVSETTLRQIGQELHDDVGQILTGAAMLAGTMARSLAQRQQAEAPTAGRLAALLNDAVGKLRALSRGLFPIGLETAGLGAMLDALAMQLRASTPLDIQMQRAGDAPLLSQEQALQIYRIVQEAASNAVRHSGAKTLRLSFCGRPGALSVVVADDGFGIEHDRRQRGGGIGLRTMHARAARIGAGLRIHTPAEGGTRVELELPWPAAAAAVAA